MLKVSFRACECDRSTNHILNQLYQPLKRMSAALAGEYGGTMENLWVDFDLTPLREKQSGPWAFRMQKRVSGRSPLTGIDLPDSYNVGHYSVTPDYPALLALSDEAVVPYVLALIFESLNGLTGKKSLKGFDLVAFKSAFIRSAGDLGYDIGQLRSDA